MRVYHLDCWSGLAGDMFLGACLDLGMPPAVLEETVARLALPRVGIRARKEARGGLAGTYFQVLLDGRPVEEAGEHTHPHPHHHPPGPEHGRSLADILALLRASALDSPVRERAERLFVRLGEAEAKAHGVPLETIHFHEVGAADSIVDLAGAAAAVEHLAPERLTASPVNLGGGRVRTAHGELPVPAPATAELLRGVPVYGSGDGELTTPTGAALLAELVDGFGAAPAMVLEGSGYGLGRRDTRERPNAVRLLAGQAAADAARGEVMVVECEVDDLPGEGFGYLMESLLAAGALDVYFTAVQMKKNRPGTLVTLLCRPAELEPLAARLLAESGSLGCRFHRAARFEAEREAAEVATPYGAVAVKRARLDGRPLAAAPEFESVRRLALERGLPWREVHRAALAALARDETG
ncbi:MAG TPA: nickel pincer cofactor biosynthesis protein LarC [Thermoanaerobaculia bacterium]|nr:nickel pincer cofactor biosynthesis protein LarC [Thermoanaerobaculia bacterium]